MSFLSAAPRIIGHRGAAGLAPENTLPSFAVAYQHGVDAVELDVYCVGGVLVVIHDETLDRTTDLTGRVDQQSVKALRRANAGGGASVPTLDDVWAELPQAVGLNIELEGPDTAEPVADWLADLVTSNEAQIDPGRVMVSSFDHEQLARFSRHAVRPNVLVAPLFHRWQTNWREVADGLNTQWINFNQKLLTRTRMRNLLEAQMQVSAYTVNSKRRAQTLVRLGVSGLFTDRPDLVSRSALTG